jgi:Fic family protein
MLNSVLIGLLSGIVAGVIIGYFLRRKKKRVQSQQERKKEENIAKLKEFVASSSGKITNDQVEKLLAVSDATAERYLNDLEAEGLIKQVGKDGQSVYYEKR